MIPRYSREEMSKIWSDEARFQIWLEVETLALEGMVKEGLAPKEALDAVRSKGKFDTARVLELEEELKHDVIAFLTNVAENVGPLSRYVHRGMTSSDLVDTTFAVQLQRAGKLLLQEIDELLIAIFERAKEFKYTLCIGRSHGIHAEPTSFGLKLIGWYAELRRDRTRLEAAVKDISCGKISGAVGTYASLPPAVESHVMSKLSLTPETVATQVVARDRHASFFSALALLASSIERFAVEVRHLQRTEVGEAEEKFSSKQKGSSAMPHKRNPILSENITGLARLIRGYGQVALENVALWHERDISHSSAERVIAPDATIAMDFMLARAKSIIANLVVYPDRMQANLDLTRGVVFSGTLLIKLADAGIVREEAYRIVQGHAMAALQGGANFEQRVREDALIIKTVSKEVIDEVFDIKRHLQHVDFIFERAISQ